MYCQTGTQMLRDLKTCKKWLPIYNENGMKQIISEISQSWDYMKHHHSQLNKQKQQDPSARLPESISVTTTSHLMSVQRQKRIALAYLNYRAEKIREVWWDTGIALPEELRSLLSRQEYEFLQGYDRLMTEYAEESDEILTSDLQPPKSLHVAVQSAPGQEKIGEIMGIDGKIINLDGNNEANMRREDAEPLIRQGKLIQTDKE